MKSRLLVRVMLFFMVLMIGSFDHHLSGYFSGEVKSLIQNDNDPMHSDVPVKFCDHHEDITLKVSPCLVSSPDPFPVQYFIIGPPELPLTSPHNIWQPPEKPC